MIPILLRHLPHSPVVGPSKAEALPGLPEQRQQTMREELAKLGEIPHFMTGKIIDQLKQMSKLCQGYESAYPALLAEIERATYARDTTRVRHLIETALNQAA